MIWAYIIEVLILLVGTFGTYALFRKFVLSKYEIKRSYAFASIMIFCIISFFIGMYTKQLGKVAVQIIQAIITIIMCVSLLTYMDILRKDREAKNRPVVGRPKAKKNLSDKK